MSKSRLAQFALLAIAAAFLLGLGVFLGLVGPRLLRPPGTRVLNTATVIQQIKTLSQLVTVQYTLEKVVILEDPKYVGLIPLGENRLILLAHGIVKAGVDFSQLQPDDVRVSGTKISLALPKPFVTDAYLVEKSTQVIDRKTGLLRTFDNSLEQTARRQALAEIARSARQGGIEEEATTRARAQLTSFLQLLGFTEVEITTRAK